MKLLRFGELGQEKPGMLDADGNLRSLANVIDDLSGATLTRAGLDQLKNIDPTTLPQVEGAPRIGACVGEVSKFMCIGLNYSDHAEESGMEVPAEPVLFMKATSAICGPFDDVLIPPGSEKTDWEVELGIVIGDRAKHVSEENALNHVAGYCVINDLSERAYQLERCGQWVKGKSYDTFAPMGPWLVTRDEVSDPSDLSLWLEVDGHRYQSGSTQKMVFGVAKLVSYLSSFMTLNPGDIISTGTPPGVGLGQKPPIYLKPGQIMRLSVDGLGEQQQTTKADSL
ncbi:MAG: fumarylacetoacetate hydrolase family protein [Verrucomicrobia bacterium]|jgi:2-keto-4-pentenoate hydratase/2-oxohepta-3-ene-1,7-dioic acid hydratase in catechol pathway|nr:fumarylacetoacetate hydrolase family protein [Verrucomicrobiota bacterium]MBT4273749.1 fumarylacetoacetate hydrolase family protein [Verrucomicrobiota bacterium]MBT5063400.1 fumarylacetoacetate hydrolase family protein [Verrucomicrobiota bacterium]MBT5480142.1 fumarylacetoacetate hydrolase family protein [Verrucomicrobiota bacterium]MBT6237624.1 fumarylacetoacetate hydrolase family protein [Verrucomicrobiota bacterium]